MASSAHGRHARVYMCVCVYVYRRGGVCCFVRDVVCGCFFCFLVAHEPESVVLSSCSVVEV